MTVGVNPETNTAIVTGQDIDGNAVPNASDQAGTTQPAPGSISNFPRTMGAKQKYGLLG